MSDATLDISSSGMQVNDLSGDSEFMGRLLRPREAATEVAGLRRLAHVFVHCPERILQELAEVSLDLCRAESAGITLEEPAGANETQFRWIATAGKYSSFVGAVLPRFFSPCSTCIERDKPQLFRVSKAYLDLIGVDALPVTDGILIPWALNETRGTIWVLSHESYRHFDREDYKVMQDLSDFAAIAVRHLAQQKLLLKQAGAAAAAEVANSLAHQINNPLQGLIQTVFLAEQDGPDARRFACQAMGELVRLSDLVRKLLYIPKASDLEAGQKPL